MQPYYSKNFNLSYKLKSSLLPTRLNPKLLDNQVLNDQVVDVTSSVNSQTPSWPIRQLVMILLGVVLSAVLLFSGISLVQHADPYIRSVLALEGNATQGRFIFQMNCATCHGLNGDGQVGPSLHHVSSRKSRIGLIHQVTSGDTPPMPQFQPSPQEMADLLQYLESL